MPERRVIVRRHKPLTVELERRKLRAQLARILPPAVLDTYTDLVGGLVGEDLDAVIRFALQSFLHDRVERLQALTMQRLR